MPITQSWLKDTVDERILWLTNEAAAEAVVGNKSEASNQLTISLSWVEEADPPKIRVCLLSVSCLAPAKY